MTPKPSLLFVSPTFPDTQGNGLAMRAGMWVEALSQRYSVSLLVVPVFGGETASSRALTQAFCDDVTAVELERDATMPGETTGQPVLARIMASHTGVAERALGGRAFDAIHCFRLYTAPLALAQADATMQSSRPRLHLDLDDIESATAASLAQLYSANGRPIDAEAQAREAARYAAAEKALLPAFDEVYVCSVADARRVAGLTRSEPRVVPNAVRLPAAPVEPLTTHPFTFLFAGTLGYYPNEDAVLFFCNQVLPLIREQAPGPLRVRIVGSGAPASLAPLSHIEGVRFLGWATDMTVEYADAEVVIVPVRGGGGTRIKVLEAFAYQRPVVSTSAGVEGIDAVPGRHVLLGDTAATFADQCLRLMRQPNLRRELASRAYSLVAESYSQERISQLVASLPSPPPRPGSR